MYYENLKRLRFELGLSAQKLADKLDVSQGSIAQYENGTRKPNFEFIEKLNQVLNVNLNWFVTGEGEMFIQKQPAGLKDEIRQTVLEMLKNGELPK